MTNSEMLVALILYVALMILLFDTVLRVIRRYVDWWAVIMLLVLFFSSGLLLLTNGDVPFITSNHPVRMAYLGALSLVLAIIVIRSKTLKIHSLNLQQSQFISDSPTNEFTNTAGQDIAYETISDIVKSGSPRSISITGNWGSGKTSIIHKLKTENPDIIWFDFNPWIYTSEDALVRDFYLQLAKKVQQSIPHIGSSFVYDVSKSASALITHYDKGFTCSLVGVIGFISTTYESPEKRISRLLIKENKRVIVFIDDTERIYDPKIVNRTLQLCHYSKEIANSQVIMAFERRAIMACRPSHVSNSAEYLEKFFEIEVAIPSGDTASLEAYLLSILPEEYRPEQISKLLVKDIRTHRGSIRLANEILTLKNRVAKLGANISNDFANYFDKNDLLAISHIKLKYPLLYQDIAANRSLYTQSNSFEDDELELYVEYGDEKKSNELKAEHFDRLFKLSGITDSERKVVHELLGSLFPQISKILDSLRSQRKSEMDMRNDRNLGARGILDAYFGLTGNLDNLIQHEVQVNNLTDAVVSQNDDVAVTAAVTSFVEYCINLEDEWDSPLHLLTKSLQGIDDKELTLKIVKEAFVITLGLPTEYENHKTRLLGQIFFIITNQLLFRLNEAEKKKLIAEIMPKKVIIHSSSTPWSLILMNEMTLSSDAAEIAKYLTKQHRASISKATFESLKTYYLTDKHDMIGEIGYSDLLIHIENYWREKSTHSKNERDVFDEWFKRMCRLYPTQYLNRYTTTTHRGKITFKSDEGYNVYKPSKTLPEPSLANARVIATNLKGLRGLSVDDKRKKEIIIAGRIT
jgi:hypothetical protein